jgi:hypothetical protein
VALLAARAIGGLVAEFFAYWRPRRASCYTNWRLWHSGIDALPGKTGWLNRFKKLNLGISDLNGCHTTAILYYIRFLSSLNKIFFFKKKVGCFPADEE